MFKLDDTVRIKKTGVIGTVTDISCAGGAVTYVIDTDDGDDEEETFGSTTAVFFCSESDIEKA